MRMLSIGFPREGMIAQEERGINKSKLRSVVDALHLETPVFNL